MWKNTEKGTILGTKGSFYMALVRIPDQGAVDMNKFGERNDAGRKGSFYQAFCANSGSWCDHGDL